MKCDDCFAFSGRSYLEPLEKNLPNMPSAEFAEDYVVRVNDLNDSNYQRELVMEATKIYKRKFYNTAMPRDLGGFDAPVVLTINPAKLTDKNFFKLDPVPPNLMFVRMRVNTWNLDLVDEAIKYYSERKTPVILTFMRYYMLKLPEGHEENYTFKKKILNDYWVIKDDVWAEIMKRYRYNENVDSCGRIQVECRRCGNCLREYFATMERLRNLPK